MQQLATKVQQLDLVLGLEPEESPNLQQNVIVHLSEIEEIFSNLREGDLDITHPFLMDDIDYFIQDVQDAIYDASAEPPYYYMAGKVIGGCTNCHIQNR